MLVSASESASGAGRACGASAQTRVCSLSGYGCPGVWRLGGWGDCGLTHRDHCGHGVQNRTVGWGFILFIVYFVLT